MKFHGIRVMILLLFLFVTDVAFGQNKEQLQLEKKRNKVSKEIEYTEKLIKDTERTKTKTDFELVILNKKISLREELIYTINREVHLINLQIEEHNSIIEAMQEDLQKIRDEYAQMIYTAYKNRNSFDKLGFIFSAEDFNQAYQRLRYLQDFARYRERQAKIIQQTQVMLQEKIADLEVKKSRQKDLLASKEQEKKHLFKDKVAQVKLYNNLQDREREYKRKLKEQQKEYAALQKAIEQIIREEVARMKSKGNLKYTRDDMVLSNNFATNKGNLPWPVVIATITRKFGKQRHEVLQEIEIDNPGINIATEAGSRVRAVFQGKVLSVGFIPGSGKFVVIQHGEYMTVYAQLKDVFVSQGDKVSARQDIGVVNTFDDGAKTELHFEIRKESLKLNPEDWVAR